MPKLTDEQKKIVQRTRMWAYKIAREKVEKVLFFPLPKCTLAICYPGFWRVKQFRMKDFARNIIVYDLDKIKRFNHDVEETIIHECVHLKYGDHGNEFHCEMKKHLGRFEWEKKDTRVMLTTATGGVVGEVIGLESLHLGYASKSEQQTTTE